MQLAIEAELNSTVCDSRCWLHRELVSLEGMMSERVRSLMEQSRGTGIRGCMSACRLAILHDEHGKYAAKLTELLVTPSSHHHR
jgi:hypothetical protein